MPGDTSMPQNVLSLKVSATIADEWSNRGIHEVIPSLPDYEYGGCTMQVSKQVAQEILADCKFNGDSRGGPEDMPPGTRRAYLALSKQIRKRIHLFEHPENDNQPLGAPKCT